MNTMKSLTAVSCALFSASSLGHSGLEVTPGTLLSGMMHPFTGLDHVLTLLLFGGLISLLYAGEKQQLNRTLAGALTLGTLLGWSFLHYSGDHFAAYALGFACSSSLLMTAGARLYVIGQYLRTVQNQNQKVRRLDRS